MRHALRPFWTALLLVGVTCLWLGGNSWHVVTCSHGLFAHHTHACPDRSGSPNATTVPSCSCHSAVGEPRRQACPSPDAANGDTSSPVAPLVPDHDGESCAICQWYVCCVAISLTGIDLTLWSALTFSGMPEDAIAPANYIVRIVQPRGPPALHSA